MTCQILYRLGIDGGMDQVGDIGMPQQMRRHLKVQTIHHMAVIPCLFSQLRVKHILHIFPVHQLAGDPRLCRPGHNILPESLKLRIAEWATVPIGHNKIGGRISLCFSQASRQMIR